MSDCVIWSGGKDGDGYGKWEGPMMNGKRKTWRAHILVWTVLVGPVPKGKQVNHHCDNRACVSTDHLYVGDHQENMDDMVRRNRQAKGEESGNGKLTEDQVRAIRADSRSTRTVGKDYGISNVHVSQIKRRKVWAWLK